MLTRCLFIVIACGALPAIAEGQTQPANGTISPSGETGLVRIATADSAMFRRIRLGLNLNGHVLSGFFEDGDRNSRFAGTLSLSGSPLRHLELWLNLGASSNTNTRTSPKLLQSLGDFRLGAKGFVAFNNYLSGGADIEISLLSGVNQSGYDLSATGVRIRGLFSADLSRIYEKLPVRAHLNLGLEFDNSGNLISDDRELTNAELFALGVSEHNRVFVGLGLEFKLPYIEPFIEYTVEPPLGYTSEPNSDRPALSSVLPQRITPGFRIYPIKNLSFMFAAEFGLTPDQGRGVPAVPAYNLTGTIAYTFGGKSTPKPPGKCGDTSRGTSGCTSPITIPVLIPDEGHSPRTHIAGRIVDGETSQALSGVILDFGEHPRAATSTSGHYVSPLLEAGPVEVIARKQGYVTQKRQITAQRGQTLTADFVLVPSVIAGGIEGIVVDISGAPVADVEIRALPRARTSEPVVLSSDQDGRFQGNLPGGEWRLTAYSSKYLRTGRILLVQHRERTELTLRLTPRKTTGVRIDGLSIHTPKSMLYEKGAIQPSSTARNGLDLIIDLLLTDKSLQIQIAGHTDSRGQADANLEVSRKRAEAARQYLIDHAIPEDRVTAVGYGNRRPVAPNLTQLGRAQNRRIDITKTTTTP